MQTSTTRSEVGNKTMLDQKSALITESGLYPDLDFDTYHGQCCDAASISSTGLRTISEKGLEVFWAYSNLNPDAWPSKPKDAFRIGEAAHLMLLEPERVEARVAVSPYAEFRTKEAKAWRTEMEAAGRVVVKPSEWRDLQAMTKVLDENEDVRLFLRDGQVEVSLLWRHSTGLWQKARPDFLPFSEADLVVDYKTTEDLDRFSDSALMTQRYDIQGWMQLESVCEAMGETRMGLLYIVQETKPPFRVRLRTVIPSEREGAEVLFRAERDAEAAMRRFALAVENDDWRDHDGSARPLLETASRWARSRITEANHADAV